MIQGEMRPSSLGTMVRRRLSAVDEAGNPR